jgi:uncharacterized phage-associated protein
VPAEPTTSVHAVDVARHFVELGAAEDEPEMVSHLRLQKLLYYAQGWSLALRDRAMFQDEIEAWADGPVVRTVYRAACTPELSPVSAAAFPTSVPLSREDARFVARVWQSYKPYSAISLRDMTHSEAPWLDARDGLDSHARSTRSISHSSMKAYFRALSTR